MYVWHIHVGLQSLSCYLLSSSPNSSRVYLVLCMQAREATPGFFTWMLGTQTCAVSTLIHRAVFPAQEHCLITKNKNKKKIKWLDGAHLQSSTGKVVRMIIYKFEASLIYIAGSRTTGPVEKKNNEN